MLLTKVEHFFRDNIGRSLVMPLSQADKGPGPAELTLEGRRARLYAAISRETQAFEDELLIELPLPQRHAWLRNSRREFRLFQMTGPNGRPAMQAAVFVWRSRFAPWFGDAVVHKMGPATSSDEELYGLRLLHKLCAADGGLLTLRLQPRRLCIRELRDFEDRARLSGFVLCEPQSVTRTLLYDLRPTPEQALSAMGQKLRRKLKALDKHKDVEIRVLCDPQYAPSCQLASQASVERTGGLSKRGDWDTIFSVAQERPDLMQVVGLFLHSRPGQLLAFASASRHGTLAEYTSAGSLDDPELRKMPFNYWLVWELFKWAREQGSTCIDLGGITVGGPADPLGGVTRFKRHLTDQEVEVGREMFAVLRPGETWALDTLRSLRDRWSRPRQQ